MTAPAPALASRRGKRMENVCLTIVFTSINVYKNISLFSEISSAYNMYMYNMIFTHCQNAVFSYL